jgi:hypothetical protein
MKNLIVTLLALGTFVGCVTQTSPKQSSTTQGLTSPRDIATGSTGK